VVVGSLTAPVLTVLSNSINSVSNQVISLCNSLSNYTLLTSTFALWNDIYAKNTSNIASLAAYSNAVTPVVTSTSNTQYTISNFLYRYTPSNDANITSLSNASIYNSNAIVSLSNFSTQNNVWTSNNLVSLSNFSTLNNVWTSNSLVALSNFSTTNNAWSSNNLVALSNFSTSNNGWTSNNLIALSNFGTTNNAWTSNSLVSLSNFSTSNHFYNSNLNIYNSNLNNSNLARVIWTSNSVVFGCNCAVYSSNSLIATTATVTVLLNTFSNYRVKAATVPWTEVSGKPDFSSDGAGNDSLGAAGVTIGSAGLLMSGYALLDKNGKLTNALSDAFGKMTIDPTGYFSLNDPGSYISIGDSTTRVSKDRLLFKTGTFSNMILNPANLSYSNGIFSLCNQIALTATSISNLTHVSCSSNLTVLGSASVGSFTCTGLSLTSGLTTIGGVMSTTYAPNLSAGQYELNNFGVASSPLNAAFTGFAYTSNGSSNNYASLGIWGYNLGTQTFNACGKGNFGIKTTSPTATLDVNGTANVSTTLTSQTHSNTGNMSIGSNLSVSGTITPAALSMSTNPLYIQNGNAGLTYANVAGTGQGMDGPALYGWIGGVLGYVGNGSNFSPGRNGINGTLYWNYEKVGIGKSNPAYTLDVVGSINVSSNIYAASRIGIGTTSPGYPLQVVGTAVATTFAGALAWGYLTGVPALLSNNSSIGWSNIVDKLSYVGQSNTSLSVYSLQTPSNTMRIYTSNLCVGVNGDTNLGTHVWNNGIDGAEFGSNEGGLASWYGLSFRCLTDNTDRHVFDCRTGDTKFKGAFTNYGDASFSSNVVVGSSITASAIQAGDLFIDDSISAQSGLTSEGDIISSTSGGNNLGTSGSPWGGLNTLTASLGDATMTTMSNSGVISLNSGDGDKIVLTSVGANASKITHAPGWGVGYYSGYNTGTNGVHNFYTSYSGGWSNNLQISSQFVNINGTLSNSGNANVGGLLKVSGDTGISGIFTVSNEIRASANGTCQLRLANPLLGGSSWMYRWDSTNLYLLSTGLSNANGGWNSIRSTMYNTSGDVFHANAQVSISHSTGAYNGQSISGTSLSISGNQSNNGAITVGNVLGVNQQVDSGYGKGIRFWDSGDANWSGYMSQQGAGKSAASNTACSSLDGRTSHHIRMRVGSGASQGFIWENTGENCLMSLTADTGSLYVRSLIQTSNITVGQTLNSATHSNSANFYNGGTETFGGQLTLSNGLVMKANNWIISVPDNANRVYFAQFADTTFSSPNGQYNFQNNLGNTSIQITSNLGINYPVGDPGFMVSSSYGTKPSLDIYGYGQFGNGTVRSVISGSFSAASYRICRPFNTAYTSWTDLLTVDAFGNTVHAGTVIGTNIQSNCLSVSTNQIKIGVNAVLPPATSTQLGGGVFQLSSAGWSAVGAGATFTPVANSSIDNWSGKFQLFLKNVNTTVSPQVGYNDYVLSKNYGANITITGGASFSYTNLGTVSLTAAGNNSLNLTVASQSNLYYSWLMVGSD
jgi:hypothetical protein